MIAGGGSPGPFEGKKTGASASGYDGTNAMSPRQELQEIVAEEVPHVALDLVFAHAPAGVGDVGVFVGQHLGDDLSAVVPLVDQLIQHSRVAVLRDEAGVEQLETHPLDLFDE